MKNLKIGLFIAIFSILGSNFAPVAAAQYYGRTPSLSVSQEGSIGTIRVNVSNADSYSRVILYARSSGATTWSTSVDSIGQTDSSGYLSVLTYIGSGLSEFYVSVNGTSSNTAYLYGSGGCGYGYGCTGGITFSPSNPSLNVGQSMSVTINQPYFYSGSYYISSNSNSSVVSASISGTTINLYGLSSGTSTITVCQNNTSTCGSLYVSITGGSNSGNVWFSPSSPTMSVGQSLAVSVNSSSYSSSYYGYSNAYYISSNSNSSVVSASVSGTILNLYANQSGNSTITVCHSSLSYCGNLYVSVTGGTSYGNLWLNPTSLTLNSNQSSTVSINSNNPSLGSYYISSSSNYNVVSASISGSSLNVTGGTTGSANIVVCQYNTSGCATLYVTVNSGGYGNLWFSPSSLNLTSGQSSNVYIYSSSGYSGSYYISSNSNSYVATANISGSQLSITAQNQGSSSIVICQSSYSSNCGTFTVTVSGGGWNNYLTFSQNNLNLNSGQNATVTVYGNGSYYISSNSNSAVASAYLSSNTINITAGNSGSTAIVVCQNSPYACGTLMVNVSGGYYGGNLSFTTTSLPNMAVGQYYNYQLQVSGGTTPYNFQLTSGQLPSGLTLNSSGSIYGNPQNSNPTSFTVRVNDNYGRSASANFTISGNVLGASIYPNGQLIKEDGTIYIVYRGQKSGFASAYVFTSLGFKFANVLNTGYTGLPNTGYVINNAAAAHPWGAWVQSGQAIYFVHQDGLIPVPSWDIFVNNRGTSSLVVPANMYDFQRPILSAMSYNDSRLY